jgi:hypothetical protein
MADASDAPRWLLLVHQLPPRPSNLRVRVWRRLQQVGAVVLRNSLYVLPSTEESREDFNWVREEIAASGGEVSVLEASFVDGYTDGELVEQFRQARAADYQALMDEIRQARAAGRKSGTVRPRNDLQRELRRFRERLAAIQAIDYFGATGRSDVEQALTALEARRNGAGEPVPAPTLRRRDFASRTWVTRARPGIDRMASAWLIRRFIAPDARFAFVGADARVAARQLPFDMPDVEFGHHGEHCTFETLMHRFAISDSAAISVGRVVHDLDLKERRYGMPETAAIGRLVEGLRDKYTNDTELLEQGIVMIDALYRSFAGDGGGRKSRGRAR